jgi:sugar phosphate isomerase/epimerase
MDKVSLNKLGIYTMYSYTYKCADCFIHLTCHSVYYYTGLEVVKKVNSPNLKLMLDVFHLQQLHGNLTRNIKEMLPYVGECLYGDTLVVKSRTIFSAGSIIVILCLGQCKKRIEL